MTATEWKATREGVLDKCQLSHKERKEAASVLNALHRCLRWTQRNIFKEQGVARRHTLEEMRASLGDAIAQTIIYLTSDSLRVDYDQAGGHNTVTAWDVPVEEELQALYNEYSSISRNIQNNSSKLQG